MPSQHDFTIRMLGTTPLFRVNVLTAILDALESDPLLAPESYSTQERTNLPYRRSEVLSIIQDEQPCAKDIFIRHSKPTRYEAMLVVGSAPYVRVNFDPKIARKHWAAFFALADKLVAAFRPDVATVHIWHPWKDPPTDPDDADLLLTARCANLIPASYYKGGPRGLAMRTYFGPHYIAQFGRAFLLDTPAVVTEGPADKLRIDLEKDPWALDVPSLLAAWRRAMAHMRQSPVLATVQVKPSGAAIWTRGPACKVGGIIR